MEYRKLGKTGLKVSALSLGSWLTFGNQISDETAKELMHAAYDHGINFFDNAEGYAKGQSEIVMGNILKASGWERDSFIVSSKVFFGAGGTKPNQIGLSRKRITEACHAALNRLQVDHLDLYFCHRHDPEAPVEETVWSMHNLVQQGKILYWGTSEWSAQQITEAHLIAKQHHLIGPVVEQPQYNMFHRFRVEHDYLDLYNGLGLGTTVWSPLASGLLTGKYSNGIPEDARLKMDNLNWLKELALTEEKLNKVKKLQSVADKLHLSLAQLSIIWCLSNPHVSTVILGASKVPQFTENLKAIEMQSLLTAEIKEEIEKILDNKPSVLVF
jgi:voltage-dependent potassium channel beta subunit